MTDILVRVPAKERAHFWEEHDADLEWWTLGVVPTQFLPGDQVFFALGNEVVAYIIGRTNVLTKLPLRSDDGRRWNGAHVTWPASAFRKLTCPIPLAEIGLQVPRGFAYCAHTKLRQLVAAQAA